jgi:hypothetical protein
MKRITQVSCVLSGILSVMLFSASCYSVRIKTVNGVGVPDPVSDRTDYYRDLQVTEIDTVIKIGALDKDFTCLIKDCESGGLHIVEYRNTFGGILLSTVTFGRKRKVNIKYVCIKTPN